jgi:hypothetical protein
VAGETVKTFAGIVIFLISLFAMAVAHSCKSEVRTKYSILALEYVGESDKPVTSIVISDSKAGINWYREGALKIGDNGEKIEIGSTYYHVVPAPLLQNLIAEVTLRKGVPESEIPKDRRVEQCISVTIFTPRGTNVFYYKKESAVLLLDGLLKRCESDPSLHSDLAYFQFDARTHF